jgi:Family of unknown function (DUF6252)
MKKHIYLLITVLAFVSCTDDVKFNNPAFQTLKDNVFWRAQSYKAQTLTNGGLILEGSLGYETVTFRLPVISQKTYFLGINNGTTASYYNTLPSHLEEFTTGMNRGGGQIIVTEYNAELKTISGTFKFNAVNIDGTNVKKTEMKFTEGVFYKIPVSTNFATNN